MITSEQLNNHAIKFFKQYKGFRNIPKNFEHEAFNYVKKSDDFRYKDKVNDDTLVMILEDKGFLEYIKGTKRFHVITTKGLEFLNKKK